jgi:KaiC/GvpD/RAD55 family RecA-like ATPase
MYADSLKHSIGYEILVLDSLDVLEMAAQMGDSRRTELFYLFEWLRNLGITSFLISETSPEAMLENKYDEGYLADGVISLKLQEIGETDIQRRIRAVKLRSTNHKTGYFSLLFSEGVFRATQVITE